MGFPQVREIVGDPLGGKFKITRGMGVAHRLAKQSLATGAFPSRSLGTRGDTCKIHLVTLMAPDHIPYQLRW